MQKLVFDGPPPIQANQINKDERVDALWAGLDGDDADDNNDDCETKQQGNCYGVAKKMSSSEAAAAYRGQGLCPNETSAAARVVASKLDFADLPEQYTITFYVATDLHFVDMDDDQKKLGEYAQLQIQNATLVACLINGTRLRMYASPDVQNLDPSVRYNGWMPEMAALFDGATAYCCFQDVHEYGVIRKHVGPSEQRMVSWRMCTFDVWSILKKKARAWTALRDLVSMNGIKEAPSNAIAAAHAYQNKNVLGLVQAAEMQVRAIDKLRAHVASNGTVRYTVKKGGMGLRTDSTYIKDYYDKVYQKRRCTSLYDSFYADAYLGKSSSPKKNTPQQQPTQPKQPSKPFFNKNNNNTNTTANVGAGCAKSSNPHSATANSKVASPLAKQTQQQRPPLASFKQSPPQKQHAFQPSQPQPPSRQPQQQTANSTQLLGKVPR